MPHRKTSASTRRTMCSELNTSTERLLGIVKELEQAVSERDVINERIRDILSHAEEDGFDKNAIREVVKLRKKEPEKVKLFEELRDFYLSLAGIK